MRAVSCPASQQLLHVERQGGTQSFFASTTCHHSMPTLQQRCNSRDALVGGGGRAGGQVRQVLRGEARPLAGALLAEGRVKGLHGTKKIVRCSWIIF